TEGQRVYVMFATGDLACLDYNGSRLWAKNLGKPVNHYGHSSSLIIHQNLLLVQFDQNTGGRLFAFNSATGELAYEKERDIAISWASPILIEFNERAELILSATPFVISYDPKTGNELWRVKCMMGEVGPSPAYADGMVYAVNEYARLAGITLSDTPQVAWEFDDDLSEVASPTANEDFVIVAASWGTVSCFNSKTGERYWYHDFDDGFYSSPIFVGEFVYIIDMNGVTFIIRPGEEFELVGQNELGEEAVTIPAFMHNRIYIRGEEHLFCIGN
ncbi:PQQ-binding-like beta-propeller repeat protein, partial [Bacteroidota bacterium]